MLYSRERRVLELEERLILLDGGAAGGGIGEAAGDEVVGAAAEGVQGLQDRVQPGLGDPEAGVDQWAGHWQF